MPFNCEACGLRDTQPDLLPAVDEVLRCPHCASERPFFRPPLLVVTGTAGVGKSTLCARIAGTIPGAVLIDADIFGEDLISVVPPNQDYRAFWRSMMRIAHEVAQNDVAVVYFSTMLPEQLLANADTVAYFESVQFLCLACPPDILRARLVGREGDRALARTDVWTDFNDALLSAADKIPTATVVDAGRNLDDVERDVRAWITELLRPADV